MDKTGNGNALDSKVTGAPTREPQKCKISERAIAVLGEEGVDAAGLIATLKRVRAQSHSADRGEAGRLPTIRRKREEEARGRRGRCDEGITDKVPVGRRCAEVAALAGRSSRINPVPRGASKCTRGASGRGQPIARSRICSAGGIGCDQGCPANAPKKVVRWNS